MLNNEQAPEEYPKDTDRFCTKCDGPIKIMLVDNFPNSVCTECSEIQYGYTEEDRELVKALQDFFKNDLWRVYSMLCLIKCHIEK